MLIELFIGFVLGFVVIWTSIIAYTTYKSTKPITIDDPTNDPNYIELKNKPHCPFCGCYDLILVDDNAQLPWLSGHISELDHYQCARCYETFSDEDWSDVKTYDGWRSTDD